MVGFVPQWPEHQKQILKEMWITNTAAAIAAVLGRTRNAVIGMARRMQLPSKPNTGGGYHPRPGQVRKPSVPKEAKRPIIKVIHRPTPVDEGPVPLMEAKPYHCRAILDLKDNDGLPMVCGKQIVEGQVFSFCSEHLRLYTTKGYAR